MVGFLLDTNVVSELRKLSRAHPAVRAWATATDLRSQYLSVLVVGELRRGVERKRRADPQQSQHLEVWLEYAVLQFAGRILDIDAAVADAWGRLQDHSKLSDIDGLLAATALVHGLTLVTRDEALLSLKAIRAINPFMYHQEQP